MADRVNVLEKIELARLAKQAAAQEGYWSMVRKAGAGEDVDPEAVLAICAAARVDAVQFQRDADLVGDRFEMAAKLAAVPDLKKEYDELNRKVEARIEARRVAEELFDKEVGQDLAPRLRALGDKLADYQACHNKLLQTCPYAPVLERERELNRASLELTQRLREWRRAAMDLGTVADNPKESESRRAEAAAFLGPRRLQIEEAEAELNQIRRALAEVEKEKAQP